MVTFGHFKKHHKREKRRPFLRATWDVTPNGCLTYYEGGGLLSTEFKMHFYPDYLAVVNELASSLKRELREHREQEWLDLIPCLQRMTPCGR